MRYCSRYFKTSHVIVYLLTMLLSSFFLRYFKTSHVIVYHSVCGIVYSGKENFKTSHVIVYRIQLSKKRHRNGHFKTSHVIVYHNSFLSRQPTTEISKHLMLLFIPRISAFFSFSPPLFPLIFSIFLHFLPANTLILDRSTYHPINLLIFQAFLDFSFFFRLVKIL